MTRLLILTLLLTSIIFSFNTYARRGSGRGGGMREERKNARKVERQEFKKRMYECEKKIFEAKGKNLNSTSEDDDKSAFQSEMKAGRECKRAVQIEFLQKRMEGAKENITSMEKKLSELQSKKSE